MKQMRRWTITTHQTGRPRDVDIMLYPTTRSMRIAAAQWAHRRGGQETFEHALGVCHGFEKVLIDAEGFEHSERLSSIIRLALEHVTVDIVCHEAVHAAQHLYRLDMIADRSALAVDHFDAANEEFATLAGDLFAAVWSCVRNAERIEK